MLRETIEQHTDLRHIVARGAGEYMNARHLREPSGWRTRGIAF
jgi:hypothetical protein